MERLKTKSSGNFAPLAILSPGIPAGRHVRAMNSSCLSIEMALIRHVWHVFRRAVTQNRGCQTSRSDTLDTLDARPVARKAISRARARRAGFSASRPALKNTFFFAP